MSDADKYEKYVQDKMDWKTFGRLTLKALIIDIVLVFLIISVGHFAMLGKTEMDYYTGIPRYMEEQVTYPTKLRNVYWPFFERNSQIVFNPRCEWWCMVFLTIYEYFILSLCIPFIAKYMTKRAHDSVTTMIDIEKMAMEHKFDDETKKKLISVIPYILKNMSADNRVYFDMIMDGSVSVNDKKFGETSVQGNILQRFCAVRNNKKFIKAVAMIMAGHLQSHPEDLQRVKEIFGNEKSIYQMIWPR